MTSIPKAVLYYSPSSIWSAIVRIALHEKGYGVDEIDLKQVDLCELVLATKAIVEFHTAKGENFSPTFLRLNPKATVPTLVVPFENTLTDVIESRYKALTDTKTIVEFLDKSRSPLSRTHTTSSAPAPALAPATIAFTTKSDAIIELLSNSSHGNPNRFSYYVATDESELPAVAKRQIPSLQGRVHALQGYISEAESDTIKVSDKVKTLWQTKKAEVQSLLDVFLNADKSKDELSVDSQHAREEYLATARDAWEVGLKTVIQSLENDIIGPYVLGDHLSLADLHLAGWLSRIFVLVGVEINEDGKTAVAKLSARIKGDVGGKVVVFWDTIRERDSFKKVYGSGLV